MRGSLLLLSVSAAALAQDAPVVPAGVPVRVVLEHRVAIKRVGQPIKGRLVDSVYVFDRIALPAGTVVEGHVAAIGGVPAVRRLQAILSGNLTPPREVRAQFDALVWNDGSRLPLRTSLSRGAAHPVRVTAGRKKPSTEDRTSAGLFAAPGKMSRLKSSLLGMLPYHRQAWAAGTLFTGVLEEPLAGPASTPFAPAPAQAVSSGEQEVDARLLAPISSRTARKGTAVEAMVTRPVFSADGALSIPEGSRLVGEVVEARAARRLHRNGKLLFVFRQIQLPAGAMHGIQGYVEGVETSFEAHLALDSEGTTQAKSPSTRFIFPAIAVAVAGLSFHQDYNSQGVPDQDVGGRAESGAVGLGLIGTVVAQASRPLASGIAITGAACSVYRTFLARGEDVVLPANTPVRIGLRAHGGDGAPALK